MSARELFDCANYPILVQDRDVMRDGAAVVFAENAVKLGRTRHVIYQGAPAVQADWVGRRVGDD